MWTSITPKSQISDAVNDTKDDTAADDMKNVNTVEQTKKSHAESTMRHKFNEFAGMRYNETLESDHDQKDADNEYHFGYLFYYEEGIPRPDNIKLGITITHEYDNFKDELLNAKQIGLNNAQYNIELIKQCYISH